MEEATTYTVTCFQWAQDERSKPVSHVMYLCMISSSLYIGVSMHKYVYVA